MSDLPADEVPRYRESPWTDAMALRLRQLWHEGHSTAEIGRYLGFSKNAVISKAHRLDLPPRPSPIRSKDPIQTHERRLAYRRGRAVEKRLRTLVMFGLAPEAAYGLLATLAAPPVPKPPKHPRNGGSHICPTETLQPLAATLGPDSSPPEPPNVPTSRLRPITVKKPLAASLGVLTGMPNLCQWPIGDPRAVNPLTGSLCFLFCEAPAKAGKPYCASHCRDAYVPLGQQPTKEDTA